MSGKLSFEIPFSKAGFVIKRRFTNEMFNEICSLTNFISDNSLNSLKERVFCIQNNLTDYPKCPECSADVKWLVGRSKYAKYCSSFCSANSSKTLIERINTTKEKYGVENVFQSEYIKNKIKETSLERYGFEHHMQNPEINQKIKNTILSKYGVEYPAQNKECLLKAAETYFSRTGYYWSFNNPEAKLKSEQTNLLKLGAKYPYLSKQVQYKKATSITKHFNERRNEEGTDCSGVVYILHFPQHQAVKIGLTGDFSSRSKDLIKDFGTFKIIDIFETECCYSLEKELHQKFTNYRICLEEGCGRTEFFKEEILNLY
jgi:hypothetical protein